MHSQMKRGFLKFYLLKLLGDRPRSGYDLIKKIEQETGHWKPSTGSVYPLLQALENQGLITTRTESDREKKVHAITEAGHVALREAQRAKAEAFESIKRSLEIFVRVFGEPGEQAEEWMKQMKRWNPNAMGLPRMIRPRVFTLRQLIINLPFEHLDQDQVQHVNDILDEAIAQLGEYAELDGSGG